jgi:hypothetical protein
MIASRTETYETPEARALQRAYAAALTETAGWPDDVDVTPTAAAERIKALEGALRALVADEPIDNGPDACLYCDALTRFQAPIRHADDCPWVAARALLGQPTTSPPGTISARLTPGQVLIPRGSTITDEQARALGGADVEIVRMDDYYTPDEYEAMEQVEKAWMREVEGDG